MDRTSGQPQLKLSLLRRTVNNLHYVGYKYKCTMTECAEALARKCNILEDSPTSFAVVFCTCPSPRYHSTLFYLSTSLFSLCGQYVWYNGRVCLIHADYGRGVDPQSTELTIEPPRVSSALSFIGGVHIGARALHVLNLIWFGCIARLSQWGGGGEFPRSNDFYLPSLASRKGGWGSAPCRWTQCNDSQIKCGATFHYIPCMLKHYHEVPAHPHL